MENAWDNLTPKMKYQVFGPKNIPQNLEQSLLYLYQPITGMAAISLYFLLLADCFNTGKSVVHLTADILNSLNLSNPQVYEARLRLEGIGLLDTYQTRSNENDQSLLYHLHEPLAANAFFKESLLSYLLLSKVGQSQFDRLNQQFVEQQPDFSHLKKLTKNFNKVYQWSLSEFSAESEQLKQVSEVASKAQTKLPEVTVTFDWPFVEAELKRNQVVLTSEQKNELSAFQILYGLDEITYLDYLRQAIDVTTQELNLNLLKNSLRNGRLQQAVPVKAPAKSKVEPAKTEAPQTVATDNEFSAADQQILSEMEKTAPIIYLQAVKHQKNGYASDQEIRIIEKLLRQSSLSAGVINMLIDYVLVINNQPSIQSNYVNTIANDWAQRQIKTPQDAMRHLRKVSQAGLKKKASPSKNNRFNNRNVRRETLPDWVNKKTKDKKVSKEQADELKRKLEKLNQGGN